MLKGLGRDQPKQLSLPRPPPCHPHSRSLLDKVFACGLGVYLNGVFCRSTALLALTSLERLVKNSCITQKSGFNEESHFRLLLMVRAGWEAAAFTEEVGAGSPGQPERVGEGWGGIC